MIILYFVAKSCPIKDQTGPNRPNFYTEISSSRAMAIQSLFIITCVTTPYWLQPGSFLDKSKDASVSPVWHGRR